MIAAGSFPVRMGGHESAIVILSKNFIPLWGDQSDPTAAIIKWAFLEVSSICAHSSSLVLHSRW